MAARTVADKFCKNICRYIVQSLLYKYLNICSDSLRIYTHIAQNEISSRSYRCPDSCFVASVGILSWADVSRFRSSAQTPTATLSSDHRDHSLYKLSLRLQWQKYKSTLMKHQNSGHLSDIPASKILQKERKKGNGKIEIIPSYAQRARPNTIKISVAALHSLSPF